MKKIFNIEELAFDNSTKISWSRKDLINGDFPIIKDCLINGQIIHRIVEPPQIWISYYNYKEKTTFVISYADDWLENCVTSRLVPIEIANKYF